MVAHIEAHAAVERDGQMLDCSVRFDIVRRHEIRQRSRPTHYGTTVQDRTTWQFKQTKPVCSPTDHPRNHLSAILYGRHLDVASAGR